MSFEKAKVVMLPTNKKAQLVLGQQLANVGETDIPNDKDITKQHLYITSEDKIKKNDWVLDIVNNKVFKSDYDVNYKQNHSFKIIATTDESLAIKTECNCFATTYEGCSECLENLPQPPQEFIEEWNKEYNKSNVITDILVEYNEPCCKCNTIEKELDCPHSSKDLEGNCFTPNPNNDFYGLNIKVNPKNNSINIKRIKDNWNRDEVEELLDDLQSDIFSYLKFNNRDEFYLDKWIQENL